MKQARAASPVPAKLEICDLKDGKTIREHDVHNVKSSAQFLQKTLIWALSNGHGVQMYPPGASLPFTEE